MATTHHPRENSNVLAFRGRGARAQLREAMESRTPVRVARENISDAWVHGFVIGLSAEFCLIAEVSDAMHFDGFLVIAAGDVTTVEQDPGRAFVDLRVGLFANRRDSNRKPLGPRRIEQQKRKPAIAGNKAELHRACRPNGSRATVSPLNAASIRQGG